MDAAVPSDVDEADELGLVVGADVGEGKRPYLLKGKRLLPRVRKKPKAGLAEAGDLEHPGNTC